jgi:hypothetical protein
VRTTILTVEALFPEWKGRPRTFKILADFSRLDWRASDQFLIGLVVQDEEPEPPRTDISRYLKSVFLQVAAGFYPSGALKSLKLNGRAVSETENQSIKEVVRQHQEWSEEQITDALQRAGAKFGPRQQRLFLDRIRALNLRPIIGDAGLEEVEFVTRAHNMLSGGEPAVFLHWTAVFKKSESEGYAVDFEPFGGKLIGMAHAVRPGR